MTRSAKEANVPRSSAAVPPSPRSASDIVAFFDDCLSEGMSIPALFEGAARFAGAAVGRSGAPAHEIAYDAHGAPRETVRPAGATVRMLRGEEDDGGTTSGEDAVWTELVEEPLAAIFLERLAVSVRVIERWSALRAEVAPQPLDVLIDPDSTQAAKTLALGRLALTPETPVRLVICTGPSVDVERLVALLPAAEIVARTMHDARTVLLLLAEPESGGIPLSPGVPTGLRAAYGHIVPATHTARGFINASDTHRFSRPSPHDEGPYRGIDAVWLNGARTSPLAALAHLDRDYIALLPDVQALERLAQRHGDRILHVLEAYATTDSMRKAAGLVYMHHNSVLYWVQKAEAELGFSPADPYQRALLFISLCLHRIWRDDD